MCVCVSVHECGCMCMCTRHEHDCTLMLYIKLTCSADAIQVGKRGITGNIYSSGYNMETNAMTLIDNAL